MARRKTNKEIVARIAELRQGIKNINAYKARIEAQAKLKSGFNGTLQAAERSIQMHEFEIKGLEWVLNDKPKNMVYVKTTDQWPQVAADMERAIKIATEK
jgi:hypothetical protein